MNQSQQASEVKSNANGKRKRICILSKRYEGSQDGSQEDQQEDGC